MDTITHSLASSRLGIILASIAGASLPPRIGYRLADWLGERAAGQVSAYAVKAVLANQSIIGNGILDEEIAQRATATFRHAARCYYDLFHYLNRPNKMQALVQYSADLSEWILHSQKGDLPLVFVCPHLSNFDFVGYAVALKGLRAQVISLKQPDHHYRLQNDVRRQSGLEVTPLSNQALRLAGKRLENGGAILTALDWPMPGAKYRPTFFGRPAALPTLHARLAQKTGALIVVVAAFQKPDGSYVILSAEPIESRSKEKGKEGIMEITEAALRIAEAFIRRAPHQWLMFRPIWPEILYDASG